MKSREVVTKDNYKQIVLKRMIILCWILLAVCFVVKIFGGNFFNIVCQNERFIKVCEYIDENVWLQYVIGCISTLTLHTLYLLAISKHLWFTRKREFWIVLSSILICTAVKLYDSNIGLIADIWQYFILPILIKNPFTNLIYFVRILYAYFLAFIFQLISIITKGLVIDFTTNNSFLIAIIFMLDILIMNSLYYLYSNLNKGVMSVGIFTSWLWGKSPKTLEKMKATRLEKRAKLDQEIAEINSELDRQKNENK